MHFNKIKQRISLNFSMQSDIKFSFLISQHIIQNLRFSSSIQSFLNLFRSQIFNCYFDNHIIYYLQIFDTLMPPLKICKTELKYFKNRFQGLSQTFYTKFNKRYLSPKHSKNPYILKDSLEQAQKKPIRKVMLEQMSKQMQRLPSLIKSQQWMTMGMIKNQIYCRKHGDRYHHKSIDNLQSLQQQFIQSQFQYRINKMRQKQRSLTINAGTPRAYLPRFGARNSFA